MEEIKMYLDDAKDSMEKALKHSEAELTKIRAGKAMPNMLDGIMVDYYGAATPIQQVASITAPEARSLAVKPWEKKMISTIEKAIRDANLGLNPQNDGENIRIVIPPLTEERRKDLVKQVKNEVENGKVRVRKVRQETNDALKKLQKDGAPEDAVKKAEESVQAFTNDYINKLDAVLAAKEKELMTV
ncbi:MAG: ribosome recycling factor [Cytophagaceae bacterium]|jgi:ribosome recycling factor|nr:ribosome recycling factor [Cytophagaceae bacterium]